MSEDPFGEKGMNRSPCMLFFIVFACFITWAGSSFAATVGNIGDPMFWNPGPFQKEGGLSFIVSAVFEKQTNRLPSQMTRFAWANPNITPPEERHYQQVRSSKNSLTTMGMKIGVPFKDRALVYAVVGTSDSKVNFHYEDWTVNRTYASDDAFESGPDTFFGIGTSFVMERGEFKKIPLTLGMDISYRRYSIGDDRWDADGLTYYSDLDEIQLAVCLSGDLKRFSPYFGVKVGSVTGTEDYMNRNYATAYFDEGYVHYTQDITWSKNIGYFLGATASFKDFVTVTLEFRGGDENAMGLSATTRF